MHHKFFPQRQNALSTLNTVGTPISDEEPIGSVPREITPPDMRHAISSFSLDSSFAHQQTEAIPIQPQVQTQTNKAVQKESSLSEYEKACYEQECFERAFMVWRMRERIEAHRQQDATRIAPKLPVLPLEFFWSPQQISSPQSRQHERQQIDSTAASTAMDTKVPYQEGPYLKEQSDTSLLQFSFTDE